MRRARACAPAAAALEVAAAARWRCTPRQQAVPPRVELRCSGARLALCAAHRRAGRGTGTRRHAWGCFVNTGRHRHGCWWTREAFRAAGCCVPQRRDCPPPSLVNRAGFAGDRESSARQPAGREVSPIFAWGSAVTGPGGASSRAVPRAPPWRLHPSLQRIRARGQLVRFLRGFAWI